MQFLALFKFIEIYKQTSILQICICRLWHRTMPRRT